MATPEAPPPDAIHCFSCGSLISKEAKFCSECGADQNESTVPRPYTKYCYNCGDSIAETAAFCPACGADQEDRQIQSPRLANAGQADDGGEIRDNLLIRERDSDPERWENWHLVVA